MLLFVTLYILLELLITIEKFITIFLLMKKDLQIEDLVFQLVIL